MFEVNCESEQFFFNFCEILSNNNNNKQLFENHLCRRGPRVKSNYFLCVHSNKIYNFDFENDQQFFHIYDLYGFE